MSLRYQVNWTHAAENDLESIISYLVDESYSVALKILRKIRIKASSLYRYPQRGRLVPEFRQIPGLTFRELVIPPWRLIYRIKGKRVEVLALFDSRRDLSELLFERLSRVS